MKKMLTLTLLRKIALVVIVAGAGASLAFMLHTGRNNNSVLLVVLFAIWVLSPFAGLLVATMISTRWLPATRVSLYCLVLVITIGSMIGYSGALTPPGAKPAAIFLIVPLLSWVLMAIVILVARV